MATLPLNTNDLLKETTEGGWKAMPPNTTIGHVHLHVRDLPSAKKFYHEVLGLNITATIPNALFFAAGRYHHHIATNTWLGTDILPASPESIGLNHFSIDLPDTQQYRKLVDQLNYDDSTSVDSSEKSIWTHDKDGIRMLVRQK
jgi:catechol 2,3-dioxygenase